MDHKSCNPKTTHIQAIFMVGCGPCEYFKPNIYEPIRDKYNSDRIHFANPIIYDPNHPSKKINDTLKKLSVNSFPTVLKIEHNKTHSVYAGGHDINKFKKFVLS